MSSIARKIIKASFTKNLRYLALIGIIGVLFIFFGMLNNSFFGFNNFMNIIRQIGVLAIVSIGMTLVILTGGIDLSVGSNIAVSGMLGGWVLAETNNIVLSLAALLLCSIVFGMINGILIGKFGIASFIVTLAMMSVGRGATMLIGGAATIKVGNPIYMFLGQGDIVNIPIVLIALVILYVIFIFINNKTIFGRNIYAIGGNKSAAEASGINIRKSLILVYTITGFLCGIGAIFTVGRMGSAQPYAGNGLEFSVITAVVLGGTSLVGGTGRLKGTILGAILVGVITNGLSFLKLDTFFEYIAKGVLILIAVIIDILSNNYRNNKLTPKLDTHGVEGKESRKLMEVLKEKEKTVKMNNITKVFPGMKALDDVSFTLKPNEIHALMGENGAGKSTLMKILCGEEKASLGNITINGEHALIDNPIKAKELGIAIIHQELAIVPELSVMSNIYLGREIKAKIPLFINRRKMTANAKAIMDRLNLNIDVRKKAKNLTVSEQQMIEIVKALETKAWLIIMDEPTSSLTENEKDKLFEIIQKLKAEGISVVYISHRIKEIFEVCETVTVLRDGKLIGTYNINKLNEGKIISLMVGHELTNIFNRDKLEHGDIMFEVKNLKKIGVFEDISFKLHKGEVLGLSGLIGAGRTEIARCLFGLDKIDEGEIFVETKKANIRKTSDAIRLGIAYVPEDRKKEGFVPFMSIRENIAMPSYHDLSRNGIVISAKEKELSQKYIDALSIRTPSDEKNVVELSGGNQQKVSLAKWLATNPKVLILDEPTRGIDVGAKAEIHKIISNIASRGVAVIVISSEMPELIGCSDRIIVLREGKITAEFLKEEVTQDKIMQSAAYIKESV